MVVTGTVTWTVQQTLQDPNSTWNPAALTPATVTWLNHPDSALVNGTLVVDENKIVEGVYPGQPVMSKVTI